MRIFKKLMVIQMLVVLLLTLGVFFQNDSKAVTYLIQEADLYSKGEMVSFAHQEMAVAVQFVVYQKDGIEYPAYCLDKKLMGVTQQQGVKATVNKALEDENIWKVIVNGYPFKTPSELKCYTEHEAFAATKMAIYDVLYDYNWSDFDAYNEQGKRVLVAAEEISKNAKNSKETMPEGNVSIKPIDGEWKNDVLEADYISKSYKIVTSVESTEYTVTLEGVDIQGVKVVDENNQEKSKFKIEEQFKVLIPVSETENRFDTNITFEICVTANLKTKPILYGETASKVFQNFALASGEWEFGQASFEESYVVQNSEEENNKEVQDEGDKEDNEGMKEQIKNEEEDNEEIKEEAQKENNAEAKGEVEELKEEQKNMQYENKVSMADKKPMILPRTGF